MNRTYQPSPLSSDGPQPVISLGARLLLIPCDPEPWNGWGGVVVVMDVVDFLVGG